MSRVIGVLLLTSIAAHVHAQQGSMTYSWDINSTGSNTVTIGPGESVQLTLSVDWGSYDDIVGFAGTVYDLIGVENWTTGEITGYDRNLYPFTDDPLFDQNNEMHYIDAFQLPPFFNPEFDPSRPMWLFRIDWEPDDYTPRTVRMTDANHDGNALYTDQWGSSVEYDLAPIEGATIHIVPGPSAFLVFGLGGLVLARERHRLRM